MVLLFGTGDNGLDVAVVVPSDDGGEGGGDACADIDDRLLSGEGFWESAECTRVRFTDDDDGAGRSKIATTGTTSLPVGWT